MRVVATTAFFLLLAILPARAETMCTLMVELADGAVQLQEGAQCRERVAPASTFKVPLALMGFDAGVLTGPDEPAWPYKAEYKGVRAAEKATTTPTTWLENSVLWYSREVVKALGAERFAGYVKALGYGNADVSGDPGADNGMTRSWLNSSLRISAAEQVEFLRRLVLGRLPISEIAMGQVTTIMPQFQAGEWHVWGKTGTFYERDERGRLDSDLQVGWFVGWAQRQGDTLVFAHLIRDGEKVAGPAGPRARDALLALLAR